MADAFHLLMVGMANAPGGEAKNVVNNDEESISYDEYISQRQGHLHNTTQQSKIQILTHNPASKQPMDYPTPNQLAEPNMEESPRNQTQGQEHSKKKSQKIDISERLMMANMVVEPDSESPRNLNAEYVKRLERKGGQLLHQQLRSSTPTDIPQVRLSGSSGSINSDGSSSSDGDVPSILDMESEISHPRADGSHENSTNRADETNYSPQPQNSTAPLSANLVFNSTSNQTESVPSSTANIVHGAEAKKSSLQQKSKSGVLKQPNIVHEVAEGQTTAEHFRKLSVSDYSNTKSNVNASHYLQIPSQVNSRQTTHRSRLASDHRHQLMDQRRNQTSGESNFAARSMSPGSSASQNMIQSSSRTLERMRPRRSTLTHRNSAPVEPFDAGLLPRTAALRSPQVHFSGPLRANRAPSPKQQGTQEFAFNKYGYALEDHTVHGRDPSASIPGMLSEGRRRRASPSPPPNDMNVTSGPRPIRHHRTISEHSLCLPGRSRRSSIKKVNRGLPKLDPGVWDAPIEASRNMNIAQDTPEEFYFASQQTLGVRNPSPVLIEQNFQYPKMVSRISEGSTRMAPCIMERSGSHESNGSSGYVSATRQGSWSPRSKVIPKRMELLDLGCIGKSSGGIVKRSLHLSTLRVVAVKSLLVHDDRKRRQIVTEMRALHNNIVPLENRVHVNQEASPHPCPYIVGLYDAFAQPSNSSINLVLELMDGGSLSTLIEESNGPLPEPMIANVAFCALQGLQFLHSKLTIHRDIKPSSILVSKDGGIAKLSDFGVTYTFNSNSQNKAQTFIGSVYYMAPERIAKDGQGSTYASDVWSLGVSLIVCAMGGRSPFPEGLGFYGLQDCITNRPPPRLVPRGSVGPSGEEGLHSPELCDFIARCLVKNPEHRGTVSELLQHPFITSNDAHRRNADGSSERIRYGSGVAEALMGNSEGSWEDFQEAIGKVVTHHVETGTTLPAYNAREIESLASQLGVKCSQDACEDILGAMRTQYRYKCAQKSRQASDVNVMSGNSLMFGPPPCAGATGGGCQSSAPHIDPIRSAFRASFSSQDKPSDQGYRKPRTRGKTKKSVSFGSVTSKRA